MKQDNTHKILDPVPAVCDWRTQRNTTQFLELLTGADSEDIAVPFRPLVVETNCKKVG
jgi:hypothetical protein